MNQENRPRRSTQPLWRIDLRPVHSDGSEFLVALACRASISRDALLAAHRRSPHSDLGDLLGRLNTSHSVVAQVTMANGDLQVLGVERNDLGLSGDDITQIALAIFQQLAHRFLPSESSTCAPIDLGVWLRTSCYGATASRIEKAINLVMSRPSITAKENS